MIATLIPHLEACLKKAVIINGSAVCPHCFKEYTTEDKAAWQEVLGGTFNPIVLNTPPLCTSCEDKRTLEIRQFKKVTVKRGYEL